jgi:tripartite-type tricarboxylate transporter receptor subunit TctC
MVTAQFVLRLIFMGASMLVAAIAVSEAAEHRLGYPKAGPIRMIVGQQAGSSSDLISRVMAARLGAALGQSVVIDNRPGAGGIIGMEIGARATPDGYTLVAAATGPVAIAPHTYKKLAYDPLNDFLPVSVFAITQNLVVINSRLAVNNVSELVELAKARTAALNMASGGSGTQSHLAGVQFAQMLKIKLVHVPYKGAAGSLGAVISGEAHLMFAPAGTAIGQVKEGLLKALAVTGEKRIVGLPDLPTMEEAGLRGYVSVGWVGLSAPKGTSPAIVRMLHETLAHAAGLASTRVQLERLGAESASSSPDAFDGFVRQEYAKYGTLAKAAGLTVE